jgi:peptidoglycan/LPS O-acetylase OafA/YrhL
MVVYIMAAEALNTKVAGKRLGYIPTLDGWRAISIILVLFFHSNISGATSIFRPVLEELNAYGQSGVYIFFAISGLLICGRLLQEENKSGRINLHNFYIRRALRILPAALLYLLTIASLASILGVTKLEWFSALFFFRNYSVTGPPQSYWFTGHFWSLAVEEHFYLLLPGIMLFFPKGRAFVLGGLTCGVMIWRTWLSHQPYTVPIGYRTDTILDVLLIAALVAIAANHDRYGAYLRRLLTPVASIGLVAAYATLLVTHIRLSITLKAIVLPLLVLSTSRNPSSALGRILELAPLRWVGRLSYSLYLWQQLFFCDRWWTGPLPLGMLQEWPMKIILLFACAATSYYAIERPLVRLSHRIASSRLRGRDADEDRNDSDITPGYEPTLVQESQ